MAYIALGTICHVIFYNKVAFVDFFFFFLFGIVNMCLIVPKLNLKLFKENKI